MIVRGSIARRVGEFVAQKSPVWGLCHRSLCAAMPIPGSTRRHCAEEHGGGGKYITAAMMDMNPRHERRSHSRENGDHHGDHKTEPPHGRQQGQAWYAHYPLTTVVASHQRDSLGNNKPWNSNSNRQGLSQFFRIWTEGRLLKNQTKRVWQYPLHLLLMHFWHFCLLFVVGQRPQSCITTCKFKLQTSATISTRYNVKIENESRMSFHNNFVVSSLELWSSQQPCVLSNPWSCN
jgi:hypothetical protein